MKEENTLDIYLGKGWYSSRFGMASQCSFDEYRLIAELHIQHGDAKETVVATDTSWKYTGSHVVNSGIYDGEVFDSCSNIEKSEWH